MNNLQRLKLELNNKEYFTDEEYTQFLSENDLAYDGEYDKTTNQTNLLYTVVDVLESVANDVDLMRKIETEFATTSDAVKHLNTRIDKIKERIHEILEEQDTEEYSSFSLFFTRG